MSILKQNASTLLSTTTVTTNLSATGETTLYNVPTGKRLVLTEAWLRAGGDAGASLDFTIGSSSTLTDFVNTTAGDNLDAANDVILVKPVPSGTPPTNKSYAADTNIMISVTAAGNAVAGTVYLFGFETST